MMRGAIEGGGTKFVVAVGTDSGQIVKKITLPTKTPKETMEQIRQFFLPFYRAKKLKSIGVGSFGPLDLHSSSKTYGQILETPKLAWRKFNYLRYFKKHFSLPIYLDTDVNGAAYGERKWGAAKGLSTFLYITVGTGIGVGGFVRGQTVQGISHPEMGHIFIPLHPEDAFRGVCPTHKNCLEGLASGPSMMKRWKIASLQKLPPSHKAWQLESYYLASAIANYILCFSPERVILGGGVMHQKGLIEKVRKEVVKRLAGYLTYPEIVKGINRYIVLPKLGDEAGIKGALVIR